MILLSVVPFVRSLFFVVVVAAAAAVVLLLLVLPAHTLWWPK